MPAAYRLLFPKHLGARQRPPKVGPVHTGSVAGRLRGLLNTVNQANEGTRNAVLHWAACRVGEMVAAGELADASLAADALREVALGVGLEPGEVGGTIRSGLRTSGVYL